jgi:uncharacterized protein
MKVKKQIKRSSSHGKKALRAPKRFAELYDIILPLLEPYGVERVALFGSVVRGEAKPESDIDILVAFRKPIGLLKFAGLQRQLSERLQRPVDLVSEKGLSRYIRPYVEKEKVVLYELDYRTLTNFDENYMQ